MKLYNKVEIRGEVIFTNGLQKSNRGKAFFSGIIKSYETKDDKQYNFFSLPFIAFEDRAEELNGVGKGDIITLHGSLKENLYKDEKQIQLIVSSSNYETSNVPLPKSNVEEKPKSNITPDFFEDMPF